MALVEVKVPDIGDFDQVEVIEVLVKAGDTIKAEQSLVTVESDKASMEIPSSHAGVVKEIKVALGDKVSEGTLVLVLETAAGAAAAAPTPAAAPAAAPAPGPAAPAPVSGGGAATIEVVVPDIGDFDEVAVIELLVKPGDTVAAEQSLITVESDKASMEIPSSHAGVVERLLVKLGDKVSKGTPVVVLKAAAGAAPAPAAAPTAAPATTSAPAAPAALASQPVERRLPTAALPAHEPTAPTGHLPHASPSVRRFARELGVPLAEVKGSGVKGRITPEDVQAFVKGVMAGDTRTAAQAAKAPAATSAGGGGGGLDLL
ncbi:MAG: biotin/lipoyl-containing protein, partial [Pseudomonadota bacterium]